MALQSSWGGGMVSLVHRSTKWEIIWGFCLMQAGLLFNSPSWTSHQNQRSRPRVWQKYSGLKPAPYLHTFYFRFYCHLAFSLYAYINFFLIYQYVTIILWPGLFNSWSRTIGQGVYAQTVWATSSPLFFHLNLNSCHIMAILSHLFTYLL